jgi:hypothetical protein
MQVRQFDYTIYMLYCVTFSTPTHSGSGMFDETGHFSVTVDEAGGLPVGCFIVDTSNQNATVATLTFTIGAASDLSSGTTTGPVFTAGTYTINIDFNAATGVATADVTATGASNAGGTTTVAAGDLAGSWQMYCDPTNSLPDMAACGRNMSGLVVPDVFLDVITATDNNTGTVYYAMGAWPGAAAFTAAGNTEGVVTVPASFSAVTSLLGPGTPGWMLPAPNPMVKFPGFTNHVTYVYHYDTRTMADADVWNLVQGIIGFPELTGAGSWVNPACHNGTTIFPVASAGGWPAFQWPTNGTATQAQKECLLQYLSTAADKDRNGGLDAGRKYIPRPMGSNWGSAYTTTLGATTIEFRGSQIGGSPEVKPRFALMGLELASSAAIANETWNDSYTRMGNGGTTEICAENGFTTINLVKSGTDTFDAYFSQGESQTCGTSTSTRNSNFRAKLVRMGVSLSSVFGADVLTQATATGSGTQQPLNGSWGRCRQNASGANTADALETFSITGATIVYARTLHPASTGCGHGELGTLNAAIKGTLAAAGTTAFTWSNNSTTSVTAPLLNSGGAITLSASKILATVTGSYSSDPVGNPVPAPGDTHGLLMYMDDTTGGVNPWKLYTETDQPAPPCAVVSGYAACLQIDPMKKLQQ